MVSWNWSTTAFLLLPRDILTGSFPSDKTPKCLLTLSKLLLHVFKIWLYQRFPVFSHFHSSFSHFIFASIHLKENYFAWPPLDLKGRRSLFFSTLRRQLIDCLMSAISIKVFCRLPMGQKKSWLTIFGWGDAKVRWCQTLHGYHKTHCEK